MRVRRFGWAGAGAVLAHLLLLLPLGVVGTVGPPPVGLAGSDRGEFAGPHLDPSALPGVSTAAAPAINQSVAVGSEPMAVAYDDRNGLVYVANFGSGTVSVLAGTTGTVVATVAVGTHPMAVAVGERSGHVFVVNSGSDNVSVIDGGTNRVLDSVHVGADPMGIVYDGRADEMFVSNLGSASMSILNGSSDAVVGSVRNLTTPIGNPNTGPLGAVYVPSTDQIFVRISTWCDGGSALLRFNASSPGNLTPVSSCSPFYLDPVLDPVTDTVLVPGTDTSSGAVLSVFDGNGSGLATPALPAVCPRTGAFDPAGPKLLLLSVCPTVGPSGPQENASLLALNASTLAPVALSPILGSPTALSMDPPDRALFTTNPLNDTVHLYPVTTPPSLDLVRSAPGGVPVATGGTAEFAASAVCLFGGCPAGIAYDWSVSGASVALNATTGPRVLLSAGPQQGFAELSVHGTLNGYSVAGPPVLVTILPGLVSVSLTAAATSISSGGSTLLTASYACASGPCPAGVVLSWTVVSGAGRLNPSSGTSVEFFAGTAWSTVTVSVEASSYGVNRTQEIVLTVGQFLGLPYADGLTVLAASLGLAAAVGVAVAWRSRRRRLRTRRAADLAPRPPAAEGGSEVGRPPLPPRR